MIFVAFIAIVEVSKDVSPRPRPLTDYRVSSDLIQGCGALPFAEGNPPIDTAGLAPIGAEGVITELVGEIVVAVREGLERGVRGKERAGIPIGRVE